MSRVIVTKLAAPPAGSLVASDAYRRLLITALSHLLDKQDVAATLRSLFPSGPVGMKANCLTGKINSTSPHLATVLGDLLTTGGWSDNDIVVWERTSRELAAAGFVLNAASAGRRCLGTDANGVGYSSDFYRAGEVNSLVSRILTEFVGSNTNLAVLKDHSIAGMSAGLKNMYGAIHNPNKYHADNCNPYCAQVSALEPLRRTQALTVLEAMRVQYQGGPGYIAEYVTWYGGLVVSNDPVAADRVGLEILEHLRQKHGQAPLSTVGRPVRYLETAAQLGLGEARLAAIDLRVFVVGEDGGVRAGELLP